MSKKNVFILVASAVLIALVAGVVYLLSPEEQFRGTYYTEPFPAAFEFELSRSDGSNFRLSEMRGQVVLIFFGYTSCPDICPTTLAELNQALKELSAEQASQVRVVFVTVDPERDTPERVQEYVNHFNTSFIGLSGTENDLIRIWTGYGVVREIGEDTSAGGYLVNHTARTSLIDRDGNLRVSFAFDTPVDDIVHDLKLVLK